MNLLELMEKEAKAMGVNEKLFGRNLTLKGYDDSGKTAFNYAKDKSGVVYGYVIHLNEDEKQQLFEEAIRNKGCAINSLEELKEVRDGYYPLYWGKSELILGRLNAHLKGHKSNGNLHLCDYHFFLDKEINYSVLMVTDNERFEKYMINKYPPILKTYSN